MAEKYLTLDGVKQLWEGMKAYVDSKLGSETTESYLDLTYIKANGGSYIDTGLSLNGAYEFEITASMFGSSQIGALITAHESTTPATGRQGFMVFDTASHKIDYYWPGVKYSTSSIGDDIDFKSPFTVKQNKSILSITQGQGSYTVNLDGTEYSNDNVKLYLLHSENPNHYNYNYGIIYSAKISLGDKLIRDFRPVMRSSDKCAGLYDNVEDKFYRSIGPDFEAGDFVI